MRWIANASGKRFRPAGYTPRRNQLDRIEEAARVSARAAEASGAQNQKANNDAIATGVGAVLFWPALFFIKGDAASAQQVAQLKGDMDAIEQANIQKQCGIEFKRAPPG